jgi:nicotinamidase/pyrazinamidase
MTVFFDIDTQLDFVSPAGALYVPGAERILPAVARLNHLAAERGYPVISTTDAHGETDAEFRDWLPHCIRGTLGQAKPAATLLPRRAVVPTAPGKYSVKDAQQIILEKQQLDCFSNPNLPALLDDLEADRCVVYGVVTEFCVKCAAMGLLATGRKVELVTTATRSLTPTAEQATIDAFLAAGGSTTTAIREA